MNRFHAIPLLYAAFIIFLTVVVGFLAPNMGIMLLISHASSYILMAFLVSFYGSPKKQKIIQLSIFILFFIWTMVIMTNAYITADQLSISFFYHLPSLRLGFISSYGWPALVAFLCMLPVVWFQLKLSSASHRRSLPMCLITLVATVASIYMSPAMAFGQSFWSFYRQPEDLQTVEKALRREFGISFDRVIPKKPAQSKNIITIYVESLENLYTRDAFFPGMTPNINRLRRRGQDITDLRQQYGTGWTIAGTMASLCGLPLLMHHKSGVNTQMHSLATSHFFCVPTILRAMDYEQEFIQGSSGHFSGTEHFALGAGFDSFLGKEKIEKMSTFANQTTSRSWYNGFHDKTVFDVAMHRIRHFAKNPNRPFHVSLTSLDTHSPAHPGPDCPTYKGSKLQQAYHCVDHHIGRFIDNLEQDGLLQNTVVVIMGDHLTRSRDIYDLKIPHLYNHRRIVAFALGGGLVPKKLAMPASNFDLPETIMGWLGMSAKITPLGSNLLSSDKKPYQRLQDKPRLITLLRDFIHMSGRKKVDELGFKSQPPSIVINNESNPIGLYSSEMENLKWSEKHAYLVEMSEEKELLKMYALPKEDIPQALKQSSASTTKIIAGVGDDLFQNLHPNLAAASCAFAVAVFQPNSSDVTFQCADSTGAITVIEASKMAIRSARHERCNRADSIPRPNNGLIAHAGGAIDGHTYTNSKQAVEQSIKEGINWIELDLQSTSDGHLVAIHDWKKWRYMTGSSIAHPSLAEFRKHRLLGKYDPLDFEGIQAIFCQRPDLVLVTDKTRDFEYLAKHHCRLDRLVVEVFSRSDIARAQSQGLKHLMPSFHWQNASWHGIFRNPEMAYAAFALSDAHLYPERLQYLAQQGVCTFGYTANDHESMAKAIEDSYAYGFYTDTLRPKSLRF